MSAKQTVRIGPDMPLDLPVSRATPSPEPSNLTAADFPPLTPDTGVVTTQGPLGITIETITAVESTRGESRAQVAARVKTSHVTDAGFTIETY